MRNLPRSLLPLAAFAFLTFATLTPRDARAAGGPFGLGLILGDPTGITMKARFGNSDAVQLHLGFGFGKPEGGRLVLSLDYLYHVLGLFPSIENAGTLAPYIGIGGKLGVAEGRDDVRAGVRIPLGMAWFFRSVPFEIFFEVAVGIHFVPSTSALVDGGIGARFYF